MNCEEARPFIVRLADGELEGALDSTVAAHIEACDRCRALLGELASDRDLLRADSAPEAPAALRTRVMARIAEPAPAARSFRPALSPAALVALVIVGLSLGIALGAGISARQPGLGERLAAAGVVLPAEGGK